ncbi:hypothetical protein ACLOJK_036480 [Asimina triloba]
MFSLQRSVGGGDSVILAEVIHVVKGSRFNPLARIAQEPALHLALCLRSIKEIRCCPGWNFRPAPNAIAVFESLGEEGVLETLIVSSNSFEDAHSFGDVEVASKKSLRLHPAKISREATPNPAVDEEAVVDHTSLVRSVANVGSASLGEISATVGGVALSTTLISESISVVAVARRSPPSIRWASLNSERGTLEVEGPIRRRVASANDMAGSAPRDVDALPRNTTSLGDEAEPLGLNGGAAAEAVEPDAGRSGGYSSGTRSEEILTGLTPLMNMDVEFIEPFRVLASSFSCLDEVEGSDDIDLLLGVCGIPELTSENFDAELVGFSFLGLLLTAFHNCWLFFLEKVALPSSAKAAQAFKAQISSLDQEVTQLNSSIEETNCQLVGVIGAKRCVEEKRDIETTIISVVEARMAEIDAELV